MNIRTQKYHATVRIIYFIFSPKDKTLFQLYRCCKILIGAASKNSFPITKHCLTQWNICPLDWDQINGCSGIGLGLLIGNSFGFLRSEASHWVNAAPGHMIAFFTLVYWVVTINMKFQWLLSLCVMKSWRSDKEGCCHSWTSVGFRDGCTRAAVRIVSPPWKASSGNPSILGLSTMFFSPWNKSNQIYISEREC